MNKPLILDVEMIQRALLEYASRMHQERILAQEAGNDSQVAYCEREAKRAHDALWELPT